MLNKYIYIQNFEHLFTITGDVNFEDLLITKKSNKF
jgi:hypothetical protein